MSYCVNCGVELGACEKACPLCSTPVILPGVRPANGATPYPTSHSASEQHVRKGGIILIMTLVFLLPTSIVALADISINLNITWSGYVIGAFLMIYLSIVPPIASRRDLPVLFILIDALCIALYLLFIEYATGGSWFLSLALPIVLGIALGVSILTELSRKEVLYGLKLFAGSLFMAALLPVLIEWRLMATYDVSRFLTWSPFPLVVCIILGAICLVIDKNVHLKEKLSRKFFL